MRLAAGTKLGPYEITSLLGAGGMGEVYLAHDARLGRYVAIKILPDQFSNDGQRMARFEREAKVLASLNHPNIAAIYGLEESNNVPALVMELVDGPTLADRIKQGALPREDALPVAKQIAEALEYAHERSIIHRDLKPANVKITPNGAAKVLDFGLAKALEADASVTDISTSPTLSHAATQARPVVRRFQGGPDPRAGGFQGREFRGGFARSVRGHSDLRHVRVASGRGPAPRQDSPSEA